MKAPPRMPARPVVDAPAAEGAEDRAGGVQVIARAAAILRLLATRSRGASLAGIAKGVELPRSTVQRIVDALDQEGLVVAGAAHAGIRLGPGLLPLAAAARFEIADVARPYMEELAATTGETVDLAIFDNDRAVFIDQVQGTHRLRAVSGVGVSFPLHSSSNGKAMMAQLAEPQLSRLRKRLRLTAVTPHTITDWAELMREMERIRAGGLAFDREENSVGISAVGAAITGDGTDLAALTIPVPTQRFVQNEARLGELLLQTRARLERVLAGKAAR